MEFASVNVGCKQENCPEFGNESWKMLKLTESGQLPWLICGVCQTDIIPNPNVVVESND